MEVRVNPEAAQHVGVDMNELESSLSEPGTPQDFPGGVEGARNQVYRMFREMIGRNSSCTTTKKEIALYMGWDMDIEELDEAIREHLGGPNVNYEAMDRSLGIDDMNDEERQRLYETGILASYIRRGGSSSQADPPERVAKAASYLLSGHTVPETVMKFRGDEDIFMEHLRKTRDEYTGA